jgi:hypothetical protein
MDTKFCFQIFKRRALYGLNIKMDTGETGFEGVTQVNLAQAIVSLRHFVKTVKNLQVS